MKKRSTFKKQQKTQAHYMKTKSKALYEYAGQPTHGALIKVKKPKKDIVEKI